MSSDAHTLRHTNSSVSGSVRVRLEEVQGSVPEPEYSQSVYSPRTDGGYSDDESDDDLLELNPRGSSCCFCCGGRDTEAKKLARVGKLKRKMHKAEAKKEDASKNLDLVREEMERGRSLLSQKVRKIQQATVAMQLELEKGKKGDSGTALKYKNEIRIAKQTSDDIRAQLSKAEDELVKVTNVKAKQTGKISKYKTILKAYGVQFKEDAKEQSSHDVRGIAAQHTATIAESKALQVQDEMSMIDVELIARNEAKRQEQVQAKARQQIQSFRHTKIASVEAQRIIAETARLRREKEAKELEDKTQARIDGLIAQQKKLREDRLKKQEEEAAEKLRQEEEAAAEEAAARAKATEDAIRKGKMSMMELRGLETGITDVHNNMQVSLDLLERNKDKLPDEVYRSAQMHVVRSWVTTQDDAVRCGLGLDLPVPAPVMHQLVAEAEPALLGDQELLPQDMIDDQEPPLYQPAATGEIPTIEVPVTPRGDVRRRRQRIVRGVTSSGSRFQRAGMYTLPQAARRP